MEDQQPATSGSDHASDASVTPDAGLPPLDGRQVSGLRDVGRKWAARMASREASERSLPVDPNLTYLVDKPTRRSAFVRIRSRRAGEGDDIETTRRGGAPDSTLGRVSYLVRRVVMFRTGLPHLLGQLIRHEREAGIQRVPQVEETIEQHEPAVGQPLNERRIACLACRRDLPGELGERHRIQLAM